MAITTKSNIFFILSWTMSLTQAEIQQNFDYFDLVSPIELPCDCKIPMKMMNLWQMFSVYIQETLFC